MHVKDPKIIDIKKCEEGFPLEDGPFVRALDAALDSMHIQRQAYYGGTFIGNHAHKCLPGNTEMCGCKCNCTCTSQLK